MRQPPLAIVVLLYDSFKAIIRGFWPILLFALLGRGSSTSYILLFGSIGLACFSFGLSIIRYYRFQFHLESDELSIEQGIFTRSKTNVPFDRVQSIDFEQKLLHRALNLVSFKIISAGAKNAEIEIPALRKDQAALLREAILERKSAGTPEFDIDDEPFEEKVLFRLGIKDLVKVGVSVNHLKTGGIILAVFWGLYTQVGEILEQYSFENMLNRTFEEASLQWLYWIALMLPIFLILAFLTSLILTVIRHFNLKIVERKKGLRITSGLFNRKEQTALYSKLQIYTWVTNPIRMLFGMFNIRLKQASSEDVGSRDSIVVPGCYEDQRDMLRNWFFRDYVDSFNILGVDKAIIFRYTLFFGIIPAAAITVLGILLDNYSMLGILVWPPIAYFLFRLYQRKWKIYVNENMLIAERGIFGLKAEYMYLYKIQSVGLRQTPYQRRHNLANLMIYTAAGEIHIPYMQESEARKLADYLLYKAESTLKKWM
jgi:putative membrane protein